MAGIHRAFVRAGSEWLYYGGAHHLFRAVDGACGAILSVHHVRPRNRAAFHPRRDLEISPRFLDRLVRALRRWKIDIVPLEEMPARLADRRARRFVCFTLDGAYKDHREWAWQIFRKHEAPFALFVPTGFPDRHGELWWLALEAIIAKSPQLILLIDGREQRIDCSNNAEKERAYEGLYGYLMSRETDEEIRTAVRDLAARYRVDIPPLCENACLTWDDIGEMAQDPLVTVGAHSVNAPVPSKVPAARIASEFRMSRAVIEGALGKVPKFLAYPFGERDTVGPREFAIAEELGFTAALTARPGRLYPHHTQHLHALPRLALRNDRQSVHYLRMVLSGVPGFGSRRLDIG
jgi:peptidoglycan/xylan/chitin deacetylase (PgdA/CDA1 family)